MNVGWIAGWVLLLGMPLQVKHPGACEHAAPPTGMQWVCANENPCDCQLQPIASEDSEDVGVESPQVNARVSCLDCRIAFFVIPAYPEAARRGQKQGMVSATVVLMADGSVEQVRIQSGDRQLASAVQSAFQQWRFTPGGRAESIPVSVKFVLSENQAGSVTGVSLLNAVVTATPVR
jgi:TonB family protein